MALTPGSARQARSKTLKKWTSANDRRRTWRHQDEYQDPWPNWQPTDAITP
jgi:hypothetical protein